jgi:hypothetical protein
MANISELSLENNGEELDLSNYGVPAEAPKARFPRPGTYQLRTKDVITDEDVQVNSTGDGLKISIDPTIVGPEGEGRKLYQQVYTKTYTDRRGQTRSSFADFLVSVGTRGRIPADAKGKAELAQQQAGKLFEGKLDWRLFVKGGNEDGSDLEFKSMADFPKDANNEPIPFIEDRNGAIDDKTGRVKKHWARLEVRFFNPSRQ